MAIYYLEDLAGDGKALSRKSTKILIMRSFMINLKLKIKIRIVLFCSLSIENCLLSIYVHIYIKYLKPISKFCKFNNSFQSSLHSLLGVSMSMKQHKLYLNPSLINLLILFIIFLDR